MQLDQGENPAVFAANVRVLLSEDPRRYRNFGPFWYFVKALLKRFYGRHELPLLGSYEDVSVVARMPAVAGVADAVARSIVEYQHNATFNLGHNAVEDDDGEVFTLIDPDVEG